MFWVLLKKQFTEIFKSYFYNPKNNTGRSSKSTVALFIVFGAAMVFGLGGMFRKSIKNRRAVWHANC